MSSNQSQPLCFEDVNVGDRWVSPARTLTEADIVNFAGMTGDYNPLHVDREFARQSPYGQPIAHGLLGISWMAGLASHSPWMQTAALVRIVEWQFQGPIFIGDTVHVQTEVLSKQSKVRRRGVIAWGKKLVNQAGEIVQQGTLETLVLVRTRAAARRTNNSSATSTTPAPMNGLQSAPEPVALDSN